MPSKSTLSAMVLSPSACLGLPIPAQVAVATDLLTDDDRSAMLGFAVGDLPATAELGGFSLLLDNTTLPFPSGAGLVDLYPDGLTDFDKMVCLEFYAPLVLLAEIDDAVTGTDAAAQRNDKSVGDTVRLADWVDVRRNSEPWSEQGGTAVTWTEV